MKKTFIILSAIAISGVLAAAEVIPQKFFMLKYGEYANAEFTETEPGKITLKAVSSGKEKANYASICHNCNITVKAGTILSYKVTVGEDYRNGAHFTPAFSFIKPGEKKWSNQNGRGIWLHKSFTANIDLVKELGMPENTVLRQIKFVVNAGKNPQGKEIKAEISDLKITTPDAK